MDPRYSRAWKEVIQVPKVLKESQKKEGPDMTQQEGTQEEGTVTSITREAQTDLVFPDDLTPAKLVEQMQECKREAQSNTEKMLAAVEALKRKHSDEPAGVKQLFSLMLEHPRKTRQFNKELGYFDPAVVAADLTVVTMEDMLEGLPALLEGYRYYNIEAIRNLYPESTRPDVLTVETLIKHVRENPVQLVDALYVPVKKKSSAYNSIKKRNLNITNFPPYLVWETYLEAQKIVGIKQDKIGIPAEDLLKVAAGHPFRGKYKYDRDSCIEMLRRIAQPKSKSRGSINSGHIGGEVRSGGIAYYYLLPSGASNNVSP